MKKQTNSQIEYKNNRIKRKSTKIKQNDNYTEKQEFTFQHKLDKSQIPVCNILGVDVAAIDINWLINFTKKYIKELSGDYCCVSNVHTTVTAWEDEQYRAVQNGGILAIPDGSPLSCIGRKRGFQSMKRTTGPDYMHEIFKISAEQGWRHYFYGSTRETLEKMSHYLTNNYQGISIAGMYSPPFRKITPKEDKIIIKHICEAKPDFVWVGLGAPKQEKWMAAHQGKIKGFMIGVGAGFDYFAGNIKRAPIWMQKCNLEWLFRLIQNPRRLFYRYWHTNTRFIWNVCIKGR